ncbi:ATP-binding cassette domain-containing protein [Bacteroidota bacterium]
MSEKILKALMQLFAIIARPDSSKDERITVVESFLKRQLNHEIVQEYLKVFEEYYSLHQEKQKESTKRIRRISSSSVRVLKICTAINEELAQTQKIIVLIQLLEFVRSDSVEITEQEMEFITTVAETFNIPEDEYRQIRDFVLFSFHEVPHSEEIMLIDGNKDFKDEETKHLYVENIKGQIRVIHVPSARLYFIRYIGESEMTMNSQLVHEDKVYALTSGSSIKSQQIKPIYYGDIVSRFQLDKIEDRITFEVKDLEYKFKSGKTGLHALSFTEESGRLIGIMGASGAGKSTLLNVLNGSSPPTSGEVLINGVDIFKEKDKIEGVIGHVSQDDLLIEELSVYQNLYYNAKLCFDNYNEEQIVEAVNKTLEDLGLYETRGIQVGSPLNKKISGGQRKRLNIALELIREPSVLFLDEPTSGLSSRDSENIMDLLKELALKGALVFVVIHQPSSDIFKMFDNMIILDTGGWLIYDGDPIESIVYFKEKIHHANWNESECHVCGNVNPEQIFNIVESNVLDEYGKTTKIRKIAPTEWHGHYIDDGAGNQRKPEKHINIPKIFFKIPNKLKQFLIFVKRDVLSKLANTQYLMINFLEAPVLAFFLAYIIKYYNVNVTNVHGYTLEGNSNLPVYIFMSVIVAIFMGLTVSAEEIIKDRKIKKREAFLNLSWSSYLMSKVALLMAISAIQAFTFVMVGNAIMEIKGMYFQYWLVLFSAFASSNMMGLVISDSFKTVVTIYILIPFLVIPQILLSGIIVKYENINPKVASPTSIPWYGEIITARWAYEGLTTYQFINNDFQSQFYMYDKTMSDCAFRRDYWCTDLTNKVNYIERNRNNEENAETIELNLDILRNEIRGELKHNPQVPFEYLDELTPENIKLDVLDATRQYIDKIKRYNIKLYNKANTAKDKLTNELQKDEESTALYFKTKQEHNNEALEDFVKNRNSSRIESIMQYKDHLYQKSNPIYLDPSQKFIKAQFYAPRKQIFGSYYSTFAVNTIVIWLMTIALYIVLYFRLLKKLLDFFEEFSHRFSKGD